MSKIVFMEEARAMVGERVKAVGTCGEKKDIIVTGVLEKVDSSDTIVQIAFGSKGHTMPCSVNKNTLELVNGRCDSCNNTITDAEAFNQVCFGCGKKV